MDRISYHFSGRVDGAMVRNQTKNMVPNITAGVSFVFRLGNMAAILVYQGWTFTDGNVPFKALFWSKCHVLTLNEVSKWYF